MQCSQIYAMSISCFLVRSLDSKHHSRRADKELNIFGCPEQSQCASMNANTVFFQVNRYSYLLSSLFAHVLFLLPAVQLCRQSQLLSDFAELPYFP